MPMRAIPIPMRKRILQLYERGKSTREISEFLGFCVAAVRRVRQQYRQRGTLLPQTHRCGRQTLLTEPRQRRPHGVVAADAGRTPAEVGGAIGWAFAYPHLPFLLLDTGFEC